MTYFSTSDMNPLYVSRRKGNSEDPYISITETLKIDIAGNVILKEIPSEFERVTAVSSTNVPLVEEQDDINIEANSFYVDYKLGKVTVANDNIGKNITFTYMGTGATSIGSSRIYIEDDGSNPTRTLKDLIATLYNIISSNGLYVHPASHPPSIIVQDANNRFVTDAEKTKWNNGSGGIVSVEKFGAIGDGVADDTLAIQQAIDSIYPVEFGHKTYAVRGINFSNAKHYTFRNTTLLAINAGDSVVEITQRVHFAGSLSVNANNLKNYGIVFRNGGRSVFENMETLNARMFGLLCTTNRNTNVDNINISTFIQFRAMGCGKLEPSIPFSFVSTTQLRFAKTLFRDGVGDTFSKYVFEIDGAINPVVSYTEDATHYNIVFKRVFSATPTVTLVSGGGLMAEGNDAGVFTFQTTDIISNNGVGVRLTSLYGHSFNGLCVQGAYAGVVMGRLYRNSPIQNAVFIKPHFEVIDTFCFIVESADANTTVIEPVGNTVKSLFYVDAMPTTFLMLERGTINVPKENFVGVNPSTRSLTSAVVNSVQYSPTLDTNHTISLSKETFSKFLLITNGNNKPIVFTSADPEFGVEGEIGSSYTLPPNGRPLRLVAISLQSETSGGVSARYRVMEIGETASFHTTKNPKPKLGEQYFDTTLGKPVWCTKVATVDGTGAVTTPAVWSDGSTALTPIEYYLGMNAGARTLSTSFINSVQYPMNLEATHTITLRKDTYSKFLLITTGNKRSITFVSGDAEYGVEGEIGATYTLPPNGRNLRIVAISLQADTTAGLSPRYRVMEIGETTNYDTIKNPKPKLGEQYFDPLLGKPMWCTATATVDVNGNVTTPAVWNVATSIQTLTSDPVSPTVGQTWLRTDL